MTWIQHWWTSSALKPHTFRVKSRRWEQFWFDFRLSGLLGSSWETVTGFRCVDNALRWEIWMKTGRLRLHCTSAPVFVSCFFLFCFSSAEWHQREALSARLAQNPLASARTTILCACVKQSSKGKRERGRDRERKTGWQAYESREILKDWNHMSSCICVCVCVHVCALWNMSLSHCSFPNTTLKPTRADYRFHQKSGGQSVRLLSSSAYCSSKLSYSRALALFNTNTC